MKFNPLRRKPGWQSPDPSTRARGVAEAPLAEIAPHLAEMLRADPSPVVRRAALGRVDDLALLADRMRQDGDRAVRDAARLRYKQLLVAPEQPETERARWLGAEDDPDVLVHVATAAGEASLRRAALERIARPGFLVERCQRDPDAAIRLWLLSRIDAPSTLARIAEAARTGDKLLARAARERLEALKLAAGDPATLRARSMAICDTLNALRRERPDDFEARRAALAQEWSKLAGRVDAALARRVDGYFAALDPVVEAPAPIESETVLEAAPTAQETEAPAASAAAELSPPPEPEPEPKPELGPEPEPRAADPASREQDAATQRAHEARRAARAALDAAVAAFEQATGAGQLAAARAAQAALATQRAAVPDPGRQLLSRIAAADEAYAKLAQWQHWSNNKVRARLCADIEALVGAGMHPDGVAAKVKETQLAWQRLDESEGLEAKSAESGIARRFRAACHRAMAPTRKYFEKRRELRDGKRAQVDALVAETERQLAADPRAAAALRRRLIDALQHLDELDPRARGEQGRRLRALLDRIDATQAERASEAEAAKRKLIANLRREVARAPLAEALEKARLAQSEWARLGRAAREVEDALAQELRALVDPFFQQAAAQRTAEAEAHNASQAEARAILDELEALAADRGQAAHAEPRLAALMQRWRALPRAARGEDRERGNDRGGRDSRGGGGGGGGRGARDDARGRPRDPRREPPAREPWDERAFDRAVDRVREAQRGAARDVERALLAALREAAAICARIEDGDGDRDALAAAFAALSLPADARDAMRARLDAALAQDSPVAAEARAENAGAGEILAARAELVAGIESPDAARSLRRRLQLERLAERLQGGVAPDPAAELRAILLEWCAAGPMDAGRREVLAQRVYAAIDKPAST